MSSRSDIHSYVACDLGAESGRVILGVLQDGRLSLSEVYRFPTGPSAVGDTMRWDINRIWRELQTGLSRIPGGADVEALSVDSWGVDYVLMGENGVALDWPFHYRDPRTEAAYEAALETVPAEAIYAQTGIQFMPINTLYQLLAQKRDDPSSLAQARELLLIADYFHLLLCGVGRAERSLASTTQIYNPVTRNWSQVLLERFALPKPLLPPLVDSASVLGPLLPSVAAEVGLPPSVQVVATCSHDTGAAVAAVPEDGDDWAYLSSGTWSLLGVELPEPLINADALAAGFTNEIGYGGSVRFLKNIAGLWIVQECRRAWLAEGTDYSYEELTALADAAEPFRSLLRPDDARFLAQGFMPRKVQDFCRETGQAVPQTPGQMVRCALESLALSYRDTLERIETLTGRAVRRLHIVGGGSRNALLNQFAASATGRDVLAGPVEATAIGNLLLQAVALGHIKSIADLRQTVRDSFPTQFYAPADAAAWEDAFTQFQLLETRNL